MLTLFLVLALSPVINVGAVEHTTEENNDFVLETFEDFRYSLNEFDEIATVTYENSIINTYRTAATPFINLLSIDDLTADKFVNSSPFLGIAFSTEGKSWIFAESIDVKTDNDTYSLSPGYDSFYRGNSLNNKVHEVYTYYIGSDDSLNMVKEMFESEKTMVRFVGSKGWNMVILNDEMKEELKATYEAYTALLNYKDITISDLR